MRVRILISVPLVLVALCQLTLTARVPFEHVARAAQEAWRASARTEAGGSPRNAFATQGPPAITASSAKVETLALARAESGLAFYVSPHGGHVAAVSQKGSRFVVVYDGVTGPPFDAILNDDGKRQIHFSPDGARYAYVARAGQEYVVMVDGKELMRYPVATTYEYVGMSQREFIIPEFSANSKHVYFIIHTKTGGGESGTDRLVVDGQAGPPSKGWSFQNAGIDPIFSPDGDHYAYVVRNPADEKQAALIVDGKLSSIQGSAPQFTPDGRHLFTRIPVAGGQGVGLLIDGKPALRALDVVLHMPPVGSGVVAVLTQKGADNVNAQFLVAGGKRVEGSDAALISRVFFSPDGKHYAADCQTRGLKHFMIIDGKKGLEYDTVGSLTGSADVLFSADSTRHAYVARSGPKSFVVVDGEEFPEGYPSIQALGFGGPQGKRVGFMGFGNNSRDRWVVMDGKTEPRNLAFNDLAFSPDGAHYVYSFNEPGGAGAIYRRFVIDGVVEEDSSLLPMFGPMANEGVAFVFSPDGKHVVHHGMRITDRRQGFFIDGKFFQTGSA